MRLLVKRSLNDPLQRAVHDLRGRFLGGAAIDETTNWSLGDTRMSISGWREWNSGISGASKHRRYRVDTGSFVADGQGADPYGNGSTLVMGASAVAPCADICLG